MTRYRLLIALVMVIALLAAPAVAFTLNRLDIRIAGNGDAEVTADYSLTWVERIVVFMRIAEPERLLENALLQYSGKEVAVASVSPGETVLSVHEYATVRQTGNTTIYTTPYLDFSGAEEALKGYWFSRFVTVDASPELSVVSFPDGYNETFSDALVIPSITHAVGK
jgi:hypothetical protein